MESFKNVLLEEFKTLYKDPRAVAIVLFVPILYTLLFGFLYLNHTVHDINTAVINKSPSQASRSIVNAFDKSERFFIKTYLDNEEDLPDLFEKDEIDVVLYIPEDFTRNMKMGKETNVFLGVNTSNIIIGNAATAASSQIIQTFSKGIVAKQFIASGSLTDEALKTAMPISVSMHPLYNPTYNYTSFLLLGIVSVALQQISLMFIANSFARRNEKNDLFKYGFFSTFFGQTLLYLLAGYISMQGAAYVAIKFFGIPLRGSYGDILLLSIPFFICIACMGLFIGILSKGEDVATQRAMLIVYPSFLMTGFTWPLVAMPEALQTIAHLFPLTYFANAFRNIALMGLDFSFLKDDLIALWILAGVYFLIVWALFMFKKTPLFDKKEKKVTE